MIREITGNILTVGVMGAGLALQFRRAYPDMFREYAALCRHSKLRVGYVSMFQTGTPWPPRFIINLYTPKTAQA